VRAWLSPTMYISTFPVEEWRQLKTRERAALTDSLTQWRKRYPGVDVVEKSVSGEPAKVLVDESAAAALLVVGSHGRGGFGGLLLGSVSHAALDHAHCPVAVLRH